MSESSDTVVFLFIRFSSIGDIVLTTPVIRCVKQQVAGAKILFLTKTNYAGILKGNPYIDKLILFDGNLSQIIREIEEESPDYIIDLHHNLRTARIKSKINRISFSFKKLNLEKWILVHFKRNWLPDVHIVDRYLDTVKLFDISNDHKGLDYFIPQEDEVNLNTLPEAFRNKFYTLAAGAQHFTKRMPLSLVQEICNRLNLPVIILGGREDADFGDTIVQNSRNKVYNACGKYSINQSASLVKQSQAIITPDTGLMHIGAALKKPVISVWGNTIPEFGMYPYFPGEGSKIFETKPLSCRPCSKLGHSSCPKRHFRCMNDHSAEAIASYASQFA